MSQVSTSLSKRLFFTVEYSDGTARIGTLDSPQKDLVELTNEELVSLLEFLRRYDVLDDILPVSDDEEIIEHNMGEPAIKNNDEYFIAIVEANGGNDAVLDIVMKSGNLYFCIGSDESYDKEEVHEVAGPFSIEYIKSKLIGETKCP